MRKWSRRGGYLLVVFLWLLLVSLPVITFFLATSGEIHIGNTNRGIRLFLLQEPENQGLGFQWTRAYDNPSTNSSDKDCTRTSLRYFLWEGNGQDQSSDYCQCRNSSTGEILPLNSCNLN